ncbi:amino acid ABC transporter permease [Sneathiella litorea]|uniref:ABC transporter permease subunit n=1 Tax=Sneathiella litorea TaxID=2606216 RepID=A0A6L8W8D1_9PROT|nr:amino acid ABC transporter permease [Sneathiella litorea]MZR30722.1 ABC transporter permease subunit [Sneathiella litorea]
MIEFLEVYVKYGSQWFPRMADAALVSASLAFAGFIVAFAIGLMLSIFQRSPLRLLRFVATIYVVVFRGIPLLAILFLLYFGLPGIGVTMSAFTASAVGLGLSFGAQMAEVFRAGLEAIHRGQREAAIAVGMTPLQAFRFVTLPQAVRIISPSMLVTFIVLLKDSSLCALITVNELMLEGRALATEYFLPLNIFVAIGVFYFLIAWPLSLLARTMDARIRAKQTRTL